MSLSLDRKRTDLSMEPIEPDGFRVEEVPKTALLFYFPFDGDAMRWLLRRALRNSTFSVGNC